MRKLLMLLPLLSISVPAWSQSLAIGGVSISLNESEAAVRSALTAHGLSLERYRARSNVKTFLKSHGQAVPGRRLQYYYVKQGDETVGTIGFNNKGVLAYTMKAQLFRADIIPSGLLFENLASLLGGSIGSKSGSCIITVENSAEVVSGDPGQMRTATLECDSTGYKRSLFIFVTGAPGSKIEPQTVLQESIKLRSRNP